MNRRVLLLAIVIAMSACAPPPSSNDKQRDRQNVVLNEAVAEVGLPSIKNFREMKLLKDIYELRDQDGLTTYTYTFSEQTGALKFFCNSVGYGIPYGAQFSANETVQRYYLPPVSGATQEWGHDRLPQAEPNGLFPPASAEGTWVMCSDPKGGRARVVYVEPRIVTSPFRLTE